VMVSIAGSQARGASPGPDPLAWPRQRAGRPVPGTAWWLRPLMWSSSGFLREHREDSTIVRAGL